mmetsp:Transcript_17022/g.23831  ORF Transcript_17022/g.23831 Transcript_17022/m.23831 type:complete len:364 (+) Transcript_17022:10-1101(+)
MLFDYRSLLLFAFAASGDSQNINPWREQGRIQLRRSLLSKYHYGRDLPRTGSYHPLQGGGEEGEEAVPPPSDQHYEGGEDQQAEIPEDLNEVSQQEGGLQGGGAGGKKAVPVSKNLCATAIGEAKVLCYFIAKTTYESLLSCLPWFAGKYMQNLQGTLKLALKSSESQSDFCNKAIGANAWAIPYAMAVAPFDNIKKESAVVGDPFKATKTLYQRDGALGYWRGVWLMALQAVAEFGVYALVELIVLKHLLPEPAEGGEDKDSLTAVEKAYRKILASVAALLASAAFSSPIGTVAARMNADKKPMSELPGCGAKEACNTFGKIYNEEGVAGFYRGLPKFLLGKVKGLVWAHYMQGRISKVLTI